MSTDAKHCKLISLVDRHFGGKIDGDGERRMRGHLPDCRACQDRYRRHQLFAELDPWSPSPLDRIGTGLGIGRQSPWIASWFKHRYTAPLLLAATALCLLFVFSRPPELEQYQARGAEGLAPAFWGYRITGGKPTPLRSEIRRDDELAFAYFNPSGDRHLLVFAVDEHKHVYWYHPAWVEGTAAPRAIPLAAGRHELPEAVRHAFDGRRVTLYAVFTDSAVSVADVERSIQVDDGLFTSRASFVREIAVQP